MLQTASLGRVQRKQLNPPTAHEPALLRPTITNLHSKRVEFAEPTARPTSSHKHPRSPGKRSYTLWIHDETFSREEVLCNIQALSEIDLKVGNLVELSPAHGDHTLLPRPKSSSRYFQDDVGPEQPSRTNLTKSVLGADGRIREQRISGKFLFTVRPFPPELKAKHPTLQVSISHSVANAFGFRNRSQVLLALKKPQQCSATHVELIFRDQCILRGEMWRLTTSELADRPVYKGQRINFMNSMKATVKSIYIKEKKAMSAYFSSKTIPIFRSESARFVLFIQMSREMWDFDAEGKGDILFSRVINSFLPELFKRWAKIDAHHLVTIVLFTRVQYDVEKSPSGPSGLSNTFSKLENDANPRTQDFYRVVVNDMPSGQWTTILDSIKRESRIFLRDVSIPPPYFPETSIAAEDAPEYPASFYPKISAYPTSAIRGNILEAIHTATSYLAFEHIGRDLVRTSTSIVIVTPSAGVFEVPFKLLSLTSDLLTSRAIGIDLVCVSPLPLHSVPLFKYRLPRDTSHRPHSSLAGRLAPANPGQTSKSLLTAQLSPLDRPGSAFMAPDIHLEENRDPGDEWGHGIPDWIDISFWDPYMNKISRAAAKKEMTMTPVLGTIARFSKDFIPKVRMYEIQMMGVMESEQLDVSVPHMPNKDRPKKRPTPVITIDEATGGSPSPEPQGPITGSGFRSKSFMHNIQDSKRSMLPPEAQQRTFLVDWMNAYDRSAFDYNTRRKRRLKRSKKQAKAGGKKSFPKDHSKCKPRIGLNEPNNKSALSINRSLFRHFELDAPSHPPPPPARIPSEEERNPRNGPRPKLVVPQAPRAVNFAFRGFTPKSRAHASTQIKMEHAKALPTSRGKTPEDSVSETSAANTPGPGSPITLAATSSRHEPPIDNTSIDEVITPSKPISIKVARRVNEEDFDDMDDIDPPLDGSLSTQETEYRQDLLPGSHTQESTTTKRTGRMMDLQGKTEAEVPKKVTSSEALAPWIRPIVPWNPPKRAPTRSSWVGRWHHVYPRMPKTTSVRWKSLKSPASLPLTTEELPSDSELVSNFLQTPYRVYQIDDPDVGPAKTREMLLRDMISLRLSHGFQVVVGKRIEALANGFFNIFDLKALGKDGITIFMARGNVFHRMISSGCEIEVTKYTRRALNGFPTDELDEPFVKYRPAVRTILSAQYCKNTISLTAPPEEYNWNLADSYLAGHRDHVTNSIKQLRFWRTRFVLIPVPVPANAKRQLASAHDDNDEEMHLLGIYKLTQMWQRFRFVPPEKKRLHASSIRKEQEQNPLDIVYQTSDPSVVVAAELERFLIEDPGLENPRPLLPDSELLRRSEVTLSFLAQRLQSDKGVKLMDRRWHWRLHYDCFVGMEFVTWLMVNFRDIDTREEAVQFGNELMKHGLFRHVQQRHNFRDGNYFYQLSDEFRITRPESKSVGWFLTRKVEKSVPSTPVGDKKDPLANKDDNPEMLESGRPKPSILLAKSMKYDVDPRKRSDRPELIDLHYDRTHNPENCFHVELSWMNATPKLVEDAVMSWSSAADKYGLKLVELPISEVSSIVERQIFRRPYPIQIKLEPPGTPVLMYHNTPASTSLPVPDKYFYQKAILKKFEFVLDFEAKDSFPKDVDVSYSWGKPDFHFPQYVHRTGAVLAQITTEGHFLILANRLYSSHNPAVFKDSRSDRFPDHLARARAATFDRPSPYGLPMNRFGPGISERTNIPIISPQEAATREIYRNSYRVTELIKEDMRAFCSSTEKLKEFYAEVRAGKRKSTASGGKAPSVKVKPAMAPTMEASIPSLELPASIVAKNLHIPTGLARTQVRGETAQVTGSIDAIMVRGKSSVASPRMTSFRH